MTTHALKKYVAGLPFGPGVYRFQDASGKDLYIGKATNLKNRVGSYLKTTEFPFISPTRIPKIPLGSGKTGRNIFGNPRGRYGEPTPRDPRIIKMIDSARSFQFISTQSEIEALILESQLIKTFRPPFNIVMRDDKQYFYVGFTNDIFPKIFLTHQPWTRGPAPHHPNSARILLRAVGVPTRATPRLEIPHFIGPFTDGNILKSTLRFLRRIFPYCTCKNTHNNFCLNYHIGKCPGFCCLKKPITTPSQIKNYKENIRAIKDILSGKKTSLIKKLEKEMTTLAQKGKLEKAIKLRGKISGLKRIFENAIIIKNSEILKTHRSELGSLLKIQKPIIRIEGYDVSNIQGTHATGSMVTFINGQPDKNFYRKFKIRTKYTIGQFQSYNDRGNIEIRSGGDTGMLREILERRFRHEEWPFPDLILIDGGKGQVNMALKTLKEMAINIQIIGISKNERHMGHQLIVPGRKTPLPLTKLSSADKNLLLTIDSEAHRFAINFYRKLHRQILKKPL